MTGAEVARAVALRVNGSLRPGRSLEDPKTLLASADGEEVCIELVDHGETVQRFRVDVYEERMDL
jgi:hypothetical protein